MPITTANPKLRSLVGGTRALERVLLVATALLGAFWALELHHFLPWAFFDEQFLGLFLAVSLAATFVSIKARASEPGDRVPWHDGLLAACGLVVGSYIAFRYPVIAYELGVASWDKIALGAAGIALVIEATRRTVGWAMVVLAVACILYTRFAMLMPGWLEAKGADWPRIAVYLYLDPNALLGLPLAVAASIVVAFILFGQALFAVGGDKFLTDLAMSAMGRYRGGPAKVAVAGSSLFGMVSGNAVSNVVLNGPITIPLMIRTGYPRHMAAAIEAVASTGGQIMPPVMGVAAFLIAEFLAVPFGRVAIAATLPALLYYLALFAQVDLEAARHGLTGLAAGAIPRARDVLSRGWAFLIPLAVLIYVLMVESSRPGKAGMAAAITTFAIGAVRANPYTGARLSLTKVRDALEETGRVLLDIVAITAVAGLVIGALHLSGLAFTLSLVLVGLAGTSAMWLLGLTAIVCITLGMGMPTAIVYIMLAVLVGPALVEVGMSPLGAHLFLFYFGMLSMITPPVCLATYAAASIARADFVKTGLIGMRLGIVAYVVPFVFVLHPALLMEGGPLEIALATGTAVVGVLLLSAGCAGFLFRALSWPTRAWAVACGLMLVPPPSAGAGLPLNLAGLVLGSLLFVVQSRKA